MADNTQLLERTEALALMDSYLATCSFFVAEAYTITDIALYAYTHVAHEGGFDPGPFPQVRAWISHVQAQPRHVAMDT